MKNNKLFTSAYEYVVKNGYSIIPLRRNKQPLLKENIEYQRKRQPTDEELEKWWKKNPDANIGICTGEISGITVIDIDTGGEKITPLDSFPETYTVKTPTGGYHLYYQYDPNIGQTANTFPQFPNVDIRNNGGYVVAPPSFCEYVKKGIRITGTYKIIKDIPLVRFPIELFVKNKKESKLQSLLKNLDTMAEGSGRNNALASLLGYVFNIVPYKDHETIGWSFTLVANKMFKEPLSEKEVKTIFDSIRKKSTSKPLAKVEFIRTDKGVIIPNEENVYRTIKNDELLLSHFRFNTFTGVFETDFNKNKFEAIQRSDIIRIRTYLMGKYNHFTKIPHSTVEDAVFKYSEENKISPPAEYIKSLIWDKKSRLDTWLSSVYGCPDDVYHKAVASNWIKGMIKRLICPGSKFDYVLVLEGRQGMKKSTSLATLGGDWHVETVFTPDNKDFFMLFSGKAIVEFSEGETLSRTEAKRLKAIITMQFDKYRPPYERSAKEFPRQCVFAMTTNQDQYLKDETGNRRWLPVSCVKEADIEWIKENRDQLFAEAYYRVITLNETTYEFPEEETMLQQLMRQTTDPREEQIYDWFYFALNEDERNDGITTRMAFIDGVHNGSESKDMTKADEMIISTILKEGLKLEKKRVMDEGKRFYRFYPCEESKKLSPKENSKPNFKRTATKSDYNYKMF